MADRIAIVIPSRGMNALLAVAIDHVHLALERVGPMHQAGSDSLLTCAAFFRLRKSFFGGRLDERRFAGVLYGLGGAPQALAAS